jgi:integrase
MGRYQSGSIYERCGSFFIRFYVTELVDGQSKRVQRSRFLADKDDKHFSCSCKAVKKLAADIMSEVNGNRSNNPDIRVVDFWEKTYLPFVEKNLRYSTVQGYKQIWEQHLRNHFSATTLGEYKTHHMFVFLTSLASNLGKRTLSHIRSLASGIFQHALNIGLVESNPIHGCQVLGKTKDVPNTPHYSLEEAENIIAALIDVPLAQTVVALAFFLGLRPGEIAGLKWSDVDGEWLHIRRAVVRGIVGDTKTPESVASLPLIQPVKGMLEQWRLSSGNPKSGWVFPNGKGNPHDLREVQRRLILPALEKKKLKWKGLYAGRRGAGTILTQLTGNALAAQLILRHKNLAVTTGFYVKPSIEAGVQGMKLLEAAATGDANGKQ